MRRSKLMFTSLLLLANIMLLVHTFMPHFHHDGIICIASNTVNTASSGLSCSNNDCCWHQESDERNEKHSNADACDLQTQLQRVDRDGNEEVVNFLTVSSLFHTTLPVHASCFCLSSLLLELEPIPTPYINYYTSPYLQSSLGLRAPPVYFLG